MRSTWEGCTGFPALSVTLARFPTHSSSRVQTFGRAEMSRERTTTSPGLMILPEATLVATTGISAMSLMRPVTVTFSGEGPFPTDSVAVVKPRKSSREENFACMARASAGSTLGIFDTRTSYISMDPVSFHGLFRWISPMKTLLRSSADTSTVLGTACTLADPEKTNAPR